MSIKETTVSEQARISTTVYPSTTTDAAASSIFPPSWSVKDGAIVGLSVAVGVLFVLVLILIIIIFLMRRKSTALNQSKTPLPSASQFEFKFAPSPAPRYSCTPTAEGISNLHHAENVQHKISTSTKTKATIGGHINQAGPPITRPESIHDYSYVDEKQENVDEKQENDYVNTRLGVDNVNSELDTEHDYVNTDLTANVKLKRENPEYLNVDWKPHTKATRAANTRTRKQQQTPITTPLQNMVDI